MAPGGPQVAGLRAARDKLLLELDEQAAEAQRLALENGALQQVRPCPFQLCSFLMQGNPGAVHVPAADSGAAGQCMHARTGHAQRSLR